MQSGWRRRVSPLPASSPLLLNPFPSLANVLFPDLCELCRLSNTASSCNINTSDFSATYLSNEYSILQYSNCLQSQWRYWDYSQGRGYKRVLSSLSFFMQTWGQSNFQIFFHHWKNRTMKMMSLKVQKYWVKIVQVHTGIHYLETHKVTGKPKYLSFFLWLKICFDETRRNAVKWYAGSG